MIAGPPDRARARHRRRRLRRRARCSRASSASASSSSRTTGTSRCGSGSSYLAPGLAVLGIIQNPSGAVVPIGEGFARLLPWRQDARRDYEEMTAATAEPEIGELGLSARSRRPTCCSSTASSASATTFRRVQPVAVPVRRRMSGAARDRRGRRSSSAACSRSTTRRSRSRAGCVTGLIGPNGAGKTTLFNVITGLQTPSGGRVVLDGRRHHAAPAVPPRPARYRAHVPAARGVRQPDRARERARRARDAPALGQRRATTAPRSPTSCSNGSASPRSPTSRVEALPTGSARLVELARALATNPKVLLLDEPSSGLDEQETDALGACCTSSPRTASAVLLVEHDMPLVMEACTHINVLDFGRVIARGTPDRDPGRPVGAARRTSAPAKTAS